MFTKGAGCPYLSEQSLTPPSDGLYSDDGGGLTSQVSDLECCERLVAAALWSKSKS